MKDKKPTVRSLMELPDQPPEQATVKVTRLGLEIVLQELPFKKLTDLRGTEDAEIHYLLASSLEPNFRDPVWYRDHMGCPTPVEALKKLLRPGEVSAMVHRCDVLNGYGRDAVVSVRRSAGELQDRAVEGALEDLEKN